MVEGLYLLPQDPIVDAQGRPTLEFRAKWQQLLTQLAAQQAVIEALGDTYVAKDQGATDWAAATNTKARTTFATNTVTTAQLAQRVGALIDDLMANGSIK